LDVRRREYQENYLQWVYTGDKIMSENPSSAVGRAAIDTYLDSIEQALLAAHAPRGDRAQVIQDLESQIADMLANGPQPLTEEIVQSVIAKLEPPSHFAATYGNDKEPRTTWVPEIVRRSYMRWPLVAAMSCACLGLGCLGLLLTINTGPNGAGGAMIVLMLLVGFALTPLAIWKSVKQLQREPGDRRDRNLVLKSTLVYCAIVPALLMAFVTLATHGFFLVPFGLATFVYLQFVLVRCVHRHLSETLPPQLASDATTQAMAPSVGTAMSMPAV
jgi:hypothetical protein